MKGQGLSITTIVLAALAIIVLIVLISIVVQRTTQFGKGVEEVGKQDCGEAEGDPQPIGTNCDVIYGNFEDVPAGKICCKAGTTRQ
jgi:hypothetical protein